MNELLSYVLLITLIDLETIHVYKSSYIRRDACECKDDYLNCLWCVHTSDNLHPADIFNIL